jgi:hypothetical protein
MMLDAGGLSVRDMLELSNVLLFPAFGYIVVLERRITRLQAQIETILWNRA